MRCEIVFRWDQEEKVWTATSADIPGLILEDESFDRLLDRVKVAAVEMISLNGITANDYRLFFETEREDLVAACG